MTNRRVAMLLVVASTAACGGGDPVDPVEDRTSGDGGGVFCNIPQDDLIPILAPDGIPALTDPEFVAPDAPGAERWTDESRVIGILVEGEALAVPLGVMRHHEILNLNRGDTHLAITYCPLTGSALTFDRSVVDGREFGVSGVLTRNNLILFERTEDETSFFPQMTRHAVCGPRARRKQGLPMVASWEMRWDAWKRLHPDTKVVTFNTGFARAYDINLQSEYEEIDNPDLLISVPLDPRRPPKERVLGVPRSLDGGPSFPFEAMKAHDRLAMPFFHESRRAVMFWSRAAEAATAFFVDRAEGDLTFEVTTDGYVDQQTGSTWRLDGLAVDGPSAGLRLEPIPEAYVAFWFAWADFHPETVVRTP